MAGLEQTIILVKAWPQPSQKYGETVCCAGVTPEGEWRRLFPIRYRHLTGDAQFRRWDIVEYRPETPKDDDRPESRRVDEPTLRVVRQMPQRERAGFFDKILRDSIAQAVGHGETLTIVRPSNVRFSWRQKSEGEVQEDKEKRADRLKQLSLFDAELNQIEPCPYEMRIRFDDAGGPHNMVCGDWETGAAYFHLRRSLGDRGALEHLRSTYEERYTQAGVAFALGTKKQYPNQWLLLGVIRLDEAAQPQFL